MSRLNHRKNLSAIRTAAVRKAQPMANQSPCRA
jgi:hypothetical protein